MSGDKPVTTKQQPLSVIRTEPKAGAVWCVVERETTRQGLRAGPPKDILLTSTHREGAVRFAALIKIPAPR